MGGCHRRDQAKRSSGASSPKRPSQVYGPEHLLRLFVKLPTLIAATNLETSDMGLLQAHCGELIKYAVAPQSLVECSNLDQALGVSVTLLHWWCGTVRCVCPHVVAPMYQILAEPFQKFLPRVLLQRTDRGVQPFVQRIAVERGVTACARRGGRAGSPRRGVCCPCARRGAMAGCMVLRRRGQCE